MSSQFATIDGATRSTALHAGMSLRTSAAQSNSIATPRETNDRDYSRVSRPKHRTIKPQRSARAA